MRLRAVVRGEFKRNACVTDAEHIERLQANAVRALTNYVILERTSAGGGRNSARKKPSV